MRTNDYGQPVGDDVEGWTPRARPEPLRLQGRHCAVTALADRHRADLFTALVTDAPASLWTYLRTTPTTRADLDTYLDGLLADNAAHVMVVESPAGAALGLACYLRIDPANGSVEVGSITFGPALQRTTAATEALHLMLAHAFDDLGYRRFEWKCDALNEPSRRAAERLGFVAEGVFRNAMVYRGRNRDTAWFSITDREWPTLRPAYAAWLAADNFDAEGRQRRPLSVR